MLEMVLNVERVNDPMWMHKPPPEKTELEKRAEEARAAHAAMHAAARAHTATCRAPGRSASRAPTEQAQALGEKELGALREELGLSTFDFEYLAATMAPSDKWYAESVLAKGLHMHLLAHSAVLAPRDEIERLEDKGHVDAFCEAIRRHVPALVPSGRVGVVLLLGGTHGLLPLISLEAGANVTYCAEACGFLAKMVHASVGRHTLLSFEKENWARLPLSLALAERTKQAGSAAFKLGDYEQAVSLYTEALQAAETLGTDGELTSSLQCNRSLAYLRLGEPDAALADADAARRTSPELAKAHYRAAQALVALGRNADARAALATVLKHSKDGKNDDAERLVAELATKPDRGMPAPRAAKSARARTFTREDRAQRLTAKEVNDAIASRCDRVRAVHKPFAELRMHHELEHRRDAPACAEMPH